jgi:predicted NUDIX family phosphoesterase
MNKMDEIIIVAPRKHVFNNEGLTFQGTLRDKEIADIILENINDTCHVMRRGDAEEDSSYKQPIPYALIKRGNEIFVYERLKGAGETRLHNKLSLGVGGHMNDIEDAKNFTELMLENLYRELEEELIISTTIEPELKVIGLINDDSDEVGQVHLGILVVLEVHKDTLVSVRETEELAGKFISLDKLKVPEVYERLENWSKIVVDIL